MVLVPLLWHWQQHMHHGAGNSISITGLPVASALVLAIASALQEWQQCQQRWQHYNAGNSSMALEYQDRHYNARNKYVKEYIIMYTAYVKNK